MNAFLEASRRKLRFQTSRGSLSVEQLWDLPLNELDTLAVKYQEDHSNSARKSFIYKKTKKDENLKISFNVTLAILETKVAERDAADSASERKAKKQEALTIVKELEGKDLRSKLENMTDKQREKYIGSL